MAASARFFGLISEEIDIYQSINLVENTTPLSSTDRCRNWVIRSGHSYTPYDESSSDSTDVEEDCCSEVVAVSENSLDCATDSGYCEGIQHDEFEEQEQAYEVSDTTEHLTLLHDMDQLPDDAESGTWLHQCPWSESNDGPIMRWSHQLSEEFVERKWWGKLIRKSAKPSLQTLYEPIDDEALN